MTEETLGLDDQSTQTPEAPAKDVDGIPYCRKHHCRMKQYSGGKGGQTLYYKCVVAKCDETAKYIKSAVETVVPSHPLACPYCKGKASHCERDAKLSDGASVILVCPRCRWKTGPLPRPELAATHFSGRTPTPPAAIGDR